MAYKPGARQVAGTEYQTFNLVKVPRALIQKAKDRCRKMDPPVSLQWQIMKLLSQWLDRNSKESKELF